MCCQEARQFCLDKLVILLPLPRRFEHIGRKIDADEVLCMGPQEPPAQAGSAAEIGDIPISRAGAKALFYHPAYKLGSAITELAKPFIKGCSEGIEDFPQVVVGGALRRGIARERGAQVLCNRIVGGDSDPTS